MRATGLDLPSGTSSTAAHGRWVRRGRTVVVDLGGRGGARHREVEGEVLEGEVLAAKQVIDSRIDVHAQYSLMRMSKNPATSADASAILAAVKGGRIGGIYKEDQQVPTLLAKSLSRGWWEVIPKHADAAIVQNPKNRSAPPIVVFRSSIRQDASRLDKALQRAWGLLQSAAKLSPITAVSGEIFGQLASALGGFPAFILPITGILPRTRTLDPAEITAATLIFAGSLNFNRIRVSDALGFGGRPFTLALGSPLASVTVLNLGSGPFSSPGSDRPLLIHELTHSWQSQHHIDPFAYEVNSIASQALAAINGEDAYCYRPGKPFRSYAAEQIAASVENGFRGRGGAHEAAIIAHVASVSAGSVDAQNTLSLLVPRTEKRGAPGIVC